MGRAVAARPAYRSPPESLVPSPMRTSHLALALLALTVIPAPVRADERLEGIACRSVHLRYPAAAGTTFTNRVRVDQSAPGTYFMACGWDKGYFGIQEQGRGKKVAIFSVWDSGQNDPDGVDNDDRVKLLYKDAAVRTGRFGGEGTGGQSFLDLDWEVGDTYEFTVTAVPNGRRTEYTGFLKGPGDKAWTRLVTFSTVTGGKPLGGYYSFVEDFRRDRVSTTKTRKATFGPTWVRTTDGEWQHLGRARFTADANPVLNIDAGTAGGRFFLATGGPIANTGTKLRAEMEVPKPDAPPAGVPTPPAAAGE